MSESMIATEQPATRSPFTRLSSALGLAQKPRWIHDFRIELDQKNPRHRYSPGDVVRGTIFFTPTKAVKITHITISLYGYVHVYKNTNAPGDFVSRESLQADPSKLLGIPGIVPLFNPVEEILFGDVKLQPCRGQFQFALALPAHRLPSSIDFERGSIQYNLLATVTRPNHINPVIRSDPKKFLVFEDIDCSKFQTPKSRHVTLEAIEKKKRGKKTPSLTISAENYGTVSTASEREPSSPRSSLSPSTDESHQGDNASVSNSSSSTELRITHITSNTASNNAPPPTSQNGSQNGSQDGSHTSSQYSSQKGGSQKHSAKATPPDRLVHASAEIPRGAYLPGDSIPIHVQVSHVKAVKSMCGLIVTLYRKTHIETEPLVHQKVRDENGNVTLKPVTGDVYPKSMTGFGGLSMSNKQTSHTYRMDIAQVHQPLFVDPVTHRADIKTKLDIPVDDVHPTITHVRGDTLDFRYYIEVCLDIQGKMEEPRLLPRLTNQAIHGLGKPSARKSPSVPMSLASQGQQMIDTQAIRREKPQIITWTIDLVIGTRDSSRNAKPAFRPDSRRQADPWATNGITMQQQNSLQGSESSRGTRLDNVLEDASGEYGRALSSRGIGSASNATRSQSPLQYGSISPRTSAQRTQSNRSQEGQLRFQSHAPLPPPAPPLVMPDEPIDEKARLKQQEQRLLPSRPDVDDDEAALEAVGPASAPLSEDLEQHTSGSVPFRPMRGGTEIGEGSSVPRSTVHPRQTNDGNQYAYATFPMDRQMSGSSYGHNVPRFSTTGAFSGFDFTQDSPSRPTLSTDDKQELERRRLVEQSSAPDYRDSQQDDGHTDAPHVPTDDDYHGAFGDWDANEEGLPRYEHLHD